MRRLLAALVAAFGVLSAVSAQAGDAPAPRIAVIIDDIGYRLDEGRRAVALPSAVALAVLPHAPHSMHLARAAHTSGKEVLLHLPMQALDAAETPGPGALALENTRLDAAAVLAADLMAVPFARGVNNHMGSLLTRERTPMLWLMEELRARGSLYFVDSFTTADSVALATAREQGVPALRRDVFLDGELSADAIAAEWRRLLALARERGSAIAIGHPHSATLDLLERELPVLDAQGVQLVTLTTLLMTTMGE